MWPFKKKQTPPQDFSKYLRTAGERAEYDAHLRAGDSPRAAIHKVLVKPPKGYKKGDILSG